MSKAVARGIVRAWSTATRAIQQGNEQPTKQGDPVMSRNVAALFVVRLPILISVLIAPMTAFAHPDHATGPAPGLSHLFLDPYHLGLMAGAVALAVLLRRVWLRRGVVARRID
jgi:hypothetical protein